MRYFGIDLGTTYSCISVLDDNSVEPRICTGKDKEEKTTPSVVWYKADGTVEVGKAAKRNISYRNSGKEGDPVEIISESKRHMPESDFEGYRVKTRNNSVYYPKDVARDILKHMFNLWGVQNELELDPAYNCVITCPASYGSAERQLVQEAAEEAGIRNVDIISEPTAAAISFINNTGFKKGGILIFDLGGGTLDVTAMNVKGQTYRVITSKGISSLGGKDWDRCIFEELKRQYVQNMHTSEEDIDKYLAMSLDIASEGIKKDITKNGMFSDDVIGDQDLDFEFVLDENGFERISEKYMDIALSYIEQVLKAAKDVCAQQNLTYHVDQVVLVGGSCRMPQVKKKIEEKYPEFRDKISFYNPDFAISTGAAYYARGWVFKEEIDIHGNKVVTREKFDLEEVLPFTLGIRCISGTSGRDVSSNMLFANEKIPLMKSRIYGTHDENQPGVNVVIIQNTTKMPNKGNIEDSETELDQDDCKEIGSFEIDLPPNTPKNTDVYIELTVKTSGIVICNAKCMGIEKTHELKISTKTKSV